MFDREDSGRRVNDDCGACAAKAQQQADVGRGPGCLCGHIPVALAPEASQSPHGITFFPGRPTTRQLKLSSEISI